MKGSHFKFLVYVIGRKCNIEVYLLAFGCKNNLPMSATPKLVQLFKDVSVDTKALNMVTFSHTFTKYKIVDGLSLWRKKMIVESLKKYPVSINMDVCTGSRGMKVFIITVSYFEKAIKEIVLKHYWPFESARVDSQEYFKKSVKFLPGMKFPLAASHQV